MGTNVTLLLLLLVWLSKTDLLKNLLLMILTTQFLKSIKHYVIFIQQVTLIYLIEESYNGRQVRTDEELKEIFEDMEADYWIDYYQSLCE